MPGITQLDVQRIARRAASEYLTSNVALTDNIQKIAGEEALTPPQVRSVCAAANRIVYGQLYNQAPPNDRVIEFPLADAATILGTEKTASVPWTPPDEMPGRYVPGQELFPADLGMEKVAESQVPVVDLVGALVLAKEVNETFRGEVAATESRMTTVWELLKEAAVYELDNGATVGDLISALTFYSPGPGFLREALGPVLDRADEKGVLLKAGGVDLRVPNPRNLTVERFRKLAECAEQYLTARYAHEEAEGAYRQAKEKLTEASIGSA